MNARDKYQAKLAATPVPPGTHPFPARSTLSCDDCGETATGDYIVHTGMTRDDRLDVARRHLTENEGWDCGVAGDFCPDCKGDEPGMCPACDTAATERCTFCESCRCDRHDDCARRAAEQAEEEKSAAEYRAKLEAAKAEGQRQADEFNRRYAIGTPVMAYPIVRPDDPIAVAYQKRAAEGRTFGHDDPCTRLETVTRTPAWILGHGEPVVSVEGYAGGICLSHVDIAPRTNTPDRVKVNDQGEKTTTIKLKRACNGCGQLLGDVDNRDVDDRGNLTDVRAECDRCRPLVELEAAGCRTWELTPRSFTRVMGEIDRLRPWVFTKGYWQEVDGKLQVVGLRVGERPNHVVAFWGDWIVRHPDGKFTVHKAPAVAA